MKKILVTVLALMLALSLCACAKTEKPAEPVGLANPMREVKAEELEIPLNVPADATDVHYFLYTFSDGKKMSEAQFTLGGKAMFVRAQPESGFEPINISGLFYTFTEADTQVNGMAAKVYTCDQAGYISFIDAAPGIAYNMGCTGSVTAEELEQLAIDCYKPVQGNVG